MVVVSSWYTPGLVGPLLFRLRGCQGIEVGGPRGSDSSDVEGGSNCSGSIASSAASSVASDSESGGFGVGTGASSEGGCLDLLIVSSV